MFSNNRESFVVDDHIQFNKDAWETVPLESCYRTPTQELLAWVVAIGFPNHRPTGARPECFDKRYDADFCAASQCITPVALKAKRLASTPQISQATFDAITKSLRKHKDVMYQILVGGKSVSDFAKPKTTAYESLKKQVQRLRAAAKQIESWRKESPRDLRFQPYAFAGVGGTNPKHYLAGEDDSYEDAEARTRHRYSWDRK